MSQLFFRRTKRNEYVQRFIMMNNSKGVEVCINDGLYLIAVSKDERQIYYWQSVAFVDSTESEFKEVFAKVCDTQLEILSFFEELND